MARKDLVNQLARIVPQRQCRCVGGAADFPNGKAARAEGLKPVEITIPIGIAGPAADGQSPKIGITAP